MIKKGYRKLAHKYHPDVSKLADAEERFKEMAEAYASLKPPINAQLTTSWARISPSRIFSRRRIGWRSSANIFMANSFQTTILTWPIFCLHSVATGNGRTINFRATSRTSMSQYRSPSTKPIAGPNTISS